MLATLDWSTVATLATAVGTLVLAVATFASVRSANRAAAASPRRRFRPTSVRSSATSRIQDPMQKIRWVDDHWAHLDGGQGSAEWEDGSIYLAISLRNVGTGLAVPIGWLLSPDVARTDRSHEDPDSFRRQTRDLFIASGDMGFWQAAIREPADPDYGWLTKYLNEATPFTVELLSTAMPKAGSGRSPASG